MILLPFIRVRLLISRPGWACLCLAGSFATAPAAVKTWDAAVDTLWDTGATTNWTGSAWASGDDAIFGAVGAGPVQIIGAGVTVRTITFDAEGYVLGGVSLPPTFPWARRPPSAPIRTRPSRRISTWFRRRPGWWRRARP